MQKLFAVDAISCLPEFVEMDRECSKGGVVVVQEEYPALKSKAARSAQGFYDYMNKLEQEMNEVRTRSGDPGRRRGFEAHLRVHHIWPNPGWVSR